ncbi:MbtH family NRPS accessory protein [Streptomyces sp. NPDC015125]|uniref:MbtH family NRPS accessory protein n=1 Tax=Streptomyces sp. NPDC015125 TaxID=3364938 RepID=UPI00370037A8
MHDGGSEVRHSFDSENARFPVVVNKERTYSLSLEFAEVQTGDVVSGPSGRQSRLDHETATWADMRPESPLSAGDRAGT